MAERLGGPAGVGAVSNVDRASFPAPRIPPFQAMIVTRPPGLDGSTTITVTGILGASAAEGLMALETSLGTVLLRPLPGAWPANMRPGSELSLTLGPGNRAGAVELRTEPGRGMPAPSMAPGQASARAVGGAEAGLRGLLMPTQDRPSALVPPAGTGQRQSQADQVHASVRPTAPGAVRASSMNPGLLATTAAGPRSIAPPAVPVQADGGPRRPSSVATAQAVVGAQGAASAQANDLMRQAGLRAGGTALPGLDSSPQHAAALDTALPEAEVPLPRPDQQLLAAISHPGMMARMAALLPRSDQMGGLALMLYLMGVRTGGARTWIGEEGLSRLTRGEAAALEELDTRMVMEERVTADGRTWRTVLVPYLDGEELTAVLLAGARDPAAVLSDEEQTAEGPDEQAMPVRFVVGLHLSELGAVQIRGRALGSRVELVLTLGAEPGPQIRAGFEAALAKALPAAGGGDLSIRWNTAPELPDLLPAGRSSSRNLSI